MKNINKKITRLEIIETYGGMNGGRKYVKHDCNLKYSLQDDGRTLKIFVYKKH